MSQPRCHCKCGWAAGQSFSDGLSQPMAFDVVGSLQPGVGRQAVQACPTLRNVTRFGKK